MNLKLSNKTPYQVENVVILYGKNSPKIKIK